MKRLLAGLVQGTLAQPVVHREWIEHYYGLEDAAFYDEAFDYIATVFGDTKESVILDAGCGNCAHSIRLAKRGFRVKAIDFSEFVLEQARENVKKENLAGLINIEREDLLSLSFEDRTFDNVLCWGVLMHVPDILNAVSELSRVLRLGGLLVISEANMYSVESILTRTLKRLLQQKETVDVISNDPGVEYWAATAAGILLTRQANIGWLIREFEARGVLIKKRLPGQFTELYTRFSFPAIKRMVHAFNKFWFRYVRVAHPAIGNILVFQRCS